MFNINFTLQVKKLTPWFLQKDKMLAWLKELVSPIKNLHAQFLLERQNTNYFLMQNSQTIVLESLLNDYFNATGIWIQNSANLIPDNFIYTKLENASPLFAFQIGEPILPPHAQVYLYQTLEYALFTHFIVWVPNTLVFSEDEMKGLVNKYKLADKNYVIQYY